MLSSTEWPAGQALDCQMRAIQLLVRQVIVWGEGKVRVLTHELPILDLQRALDGEMGPGEGHKFKSRRSLKRREQNQTTRPNQPQHDPVTAGTAVMELGQEWRGRRNRKTTSLKSQPVPKPKKAYILPAFSLSWPIAWGHITNGERVVIESITQCHQKTTDLEVQKFQSRRPLETTAALKPPSLCPEKAAIRYARS